MLQHEGDVSVIGLGEMGGALARTLLRKGWRVTVWNRSPMRARALAAEGARTANDPVEAVAASPIVIVCLSNYPAMREVLGRCDGTLAGRVVVQLGNGTPQDARDGAAWAESRGAHYLDGTILAWPSQIGGEHTVILASGSDDAFARARDALQALAGASAHTGTRVDEAAALGAATLAYLAGHWIGMAHASLLCQSEGLDVQAFAGMLADFSPVLGNDLRHMGDVIGEGRYANPESTLQTAGADIANLVRQAREAGIGEEFPSYAAGLFQRAIEAGYGPEEHVAVIKVLRNAA
ncbi:NAD(P)-dependent oxidoreductase [Marilutibacter chinensis]|uniref:NAD(P)-dependent oxidoreductase n=1 Tax=Marilutibacter chinensis TaxID=2912247 RepID=A0ABS9HR01_9GAMM|nr:NAD(P)-dependent oxidoreductase [Lysobacter chinensis]MCF7221365.1 NAD(P)-dependent oxidoreductase [Lysobacter chinensis]